MGFREEHEKWIRMHLARRRGERRDALKRGHGYGNQLFVEKVWWNLTGNFDGLHPEYEVMDWRGRSYFVDFMWIVGHRYIVIEVMDYGSHGKDRTKYRMDLNRALFLQSQGFGYIEVSLDQLKEDAKFVTVMLQSILSPYLAAAGKPSHARDKAGKIERELMQFVLRHKRMVKPAQAARELGLHRQTVIKYCKRLVKKGSFRAIPSGERGRIFRYEYIGSLRSPELY